MKINTLKALCFPETIPTFSSIAPLLLLLDGVVHYRPTENSALPNSPPLFNESDLLQSYAPAPLGDDLEIFLRMVKDLRAHAGEYSNNFLSSLSPSLADNYQKESVQQIISALTKNGELQPADQTERDEGFWQTRLLLQLAEEMRIDENDIADQLAKVSNMQQKMLHSLRDDDDENEVPAIPEISTTLPRLPIRDDLLCRAWCRLSLADHNKSRPDLLATANPEAVDLILDTYTQHCGKTAITILDLPLPAMDALNEQDFLAKREAFRNSASEIITEIKNELGKIMTDPSSTFGNPNTADQWQTAVDQHFGNSINSANKLRISLMADVTLAELCQRLGKSNKNNTLHGQPHTVLIHLAPSF